MKNLLQKFCKDGEEIDKLKIQILIKLVKKAQKKFNPSKSHRKKAEPS